MLKKSQKYDKALMKSIVVTRISSDFGYRHKLDVDNQNIENPSN